MSDQFDNQMLTQHVDSLSPSIPKQLENNLTRYLDKCGLFYRIFSRCKSASSTIAKIESKKNEYIINKKKMQDIIGVRLALYFKDDIDLCINIIKTHYKVLEIVRDEEKSDNFSPMRLNIVCEMPKEIRLLFDPDIWNYMIDQTFEVQIRTVFSEGWHEVEHDLRYKHKSDWNNNSDLSRNLNGILATLETCDWAILNVINQLAYKKYRDQDWSAMLRNHFRIRLDDKPLSNELIAAFCSNPALAKEFLKADRNEFLLRLSNPKLNSLPINLNNIVYIINEIMIHSEQISSLTPTIIKERIQKAKSE